MKFTKQILKNQLGATDEEIEVVLKYQEDLSIITDLEDENEIVSGFVVDGRELYHQLNQLKKGESDKDFVRWIKRKISNSKGEIRFIEGVDYIVFSKCGDAVISTCEEVLSKNGENYIPKEISHKFVKNPKGGRPTEEYMITIDMAKQLCMLENNNVGFNTRRYFILCEKFLKQKIDWNIVRYNQKARVEEMTLEYMKYMKKNNNLKVDVSKEKYYPYLMDTLNLLTLGKTAKEIREEREIMDKMTRDNLEREHNEMLDFAQDRLITCFKLNITGSQIIEFMVSEIEQKFNVNFEREFCNKITKYNYLFY